MPDPLAGSLGLPWVGGFDTYAINQGYGEEGWPGHPGASGAEPAGHGYAHWHYGIDFNTPEGTQLLSMGEGTVNFAGHDTTGYGLMLRITYTNGLTSLYGHQSSIEVSTGDSVIRGQAVSHSGGGSGDATNDGNSSGPHLHLGIFTALGADVDPTPFMSGAPVVAAQPAAGTTQTNPPTVGAPAVTVPLPPSLVQAQLPASLGLDPNPIKVSPFSEQGYKLITDTSKVPVTVVSVGGYTIPVLSMEITLANYRVPGQHRCTCNLDWTLSQALPARHALENLLARSPTQVAYYAGYVDDPTTATIDNMTPLFTGITDPPQMTYDPTGNTLTLSGPDLSGLFAQPGATAPDFSLFSNMTASEVAIQLAARHNIVALVTATAGAASLLDTTTQSAAAAGVSQPKVGQYYGTDAIKVRTAGQTEWDVLQELAQNEGYVCYMDGSTLVFGPPPDLTKLPAPLLVVYGPGHFPRPLTMNVSIQPQPHSKREYSVTVQSYDTGTKATASATTVRDAAALTAALSGNPDAVEQIILNMPSNTPQSTLQKRATDLLNIYAATEVLLDVNVIGVLPIFRDQPILFNGSNIAPDLNSGSPYYPVRITYRYDRQRGLYQEVVGTTRPIGVLTSQQASDLSTTG